MIYDAKQMAGMLKDRAAEIARMLLPNGRKQGGYWVCGNTSGDKGKSLNIKISGENAGVWADFATGEKGDMLSLWMATKSTSFSDALEQTARFLGVQVSPQFKKSAPKKEFKRPEKSGLKKPNEKMYEYFKSRAIDREFVDFYKVVMNEKGAITFPFLIDDELYQLKHLMPKLWTGEEKNKWWKEKDCETTLFGWHTISKDAQEVVITEGEIDAISVSSAGFYCLSIPSGAQDDTWIDNDFDRLQQFKNIALCFDSDKAGTEAQARVAKRLGMHRVTMVTLGEKDANEQLVRHGKDSLAKCISGAKAIMPSCIKLPSDYREEVCQLLDPDFLAKGSKLPWAKVENLFTFRPADLTVWTGYNGHGKTQLLNYVAINGILSGEKWMIYTPEMRPRYLLKRLITQACAREFEELEAIEIKQAIDFLDTGLFIYDSLKAEPIEKILESFEYAARRFGVTNFIIDSMQKCGLPEGGDGELAAQKRFMDKIADFKQAYDVHIHLVAHPRKGKDELTAPTKQDIKGSGSISDLVDNVMIVHRNKQKEADPSGRKDEMDVSLEVAKQRNGNWEGVIELWYCTKTLQYFSSKFESPRNFLKWAK